jgi:hypothetical protein
VEARGSKTIDNNSTEWTFIAKMGIWMWSRNHKAPRQEGRKYIKLCNRFLQWPDGKKQQKQKRKGKERRYNWGQIRELKETKRAKAIRREDTKYAMDNWQNGLETNKTNDRTKEDIEGKAKKHYYNMGPFCDYKLIANYKGDTSDLKT